MKFFGRGEEIAELQHIKEMSLERAQFTVLTGRRRVGKTERACQKRPCVVEVER